jgi:hypothetical protein
MSEMDARYRDLDQLLIMAAAMYASLLQGTGMTHHLGISPLQMQKEIPCKIDHIDGAPCLAFHSLSFAYLSGTQHNKLEATMPPIIILPTPWGPVDPRTRIIAKILTGETRS